MNRDILFFMLDQCSAKWLEIALEREVCPLPNLRRLRERGTMFTNAISNNPVCCPARATIATGLTTRGHGVLENGYELDPALPTFMRALQQTGYRTGAFGKCHLMPHFRGLHPDYRPYGFDVAHITEDGRGGEWLDWVRTEHPEYEEAVLTTFWAARIPELARYGETGEDLTSRILALRENHAWATPERPVDSPEGYALPFPKEISQTAWITRHALDFLRDAPRDRPLFAHVSYVQPHSPYGTPAEYLDLVDASRLPEPLPAAWASDPDAPQYFRERQPDLRDDVMHLRRCYFADLAFLDEQLGRLLEALSARGGEPYVMVVADHGDLLGDQGCYGKEERHYDACIRVPLMIAGPGVRAGQRNDSMVQLEDICPTVLDMAGAAMPGLPVLGNYLRVPPEELARTHGASLLPLCDGRAASLREAAYCESYNAIWSLRYEDWARTIRTQRYRYTYYAGNSGEQLFDLANDPGEQRNLAHDPAHAEQTRALKDMLMEAIIRQDWPKTRRDLYALGVH